MAVERTDTGAEAPPIPADWDGEPRFIVFFIPAPQPLTFPHGSTFALVRDEDVQWLEGVAHLPTDDVPLWSNVPINPGKNIVSFRVWRLPEDVTLNVTIGDHAFDVFHRVTGRPRPSNEATAQALGPSALRTDLESLATVFEVVTPLLPVRTDDRIDQERSISDAFDRCMANLEELYRAYIAATADVRVRPLTRRTVCPLIPWTTREPYTRIYGGLGVFLANMADTSAVSTAGTMSEAELRQVLDLMSRTRQTGAIGDPSISAVEHARRAWRSFSVDADYSVCVVWAYAGSEALCDGVLLMSAWEEQQDVEEVKSWFDVGFVKRVRTRFPIAFGGKWQTRTKGSIFGEWEQAVAQVRHRIIHANHRASESDAQRALEACGALEAYVKERLVKRRHRFPRTALMFIGGRGLENRQALDQRIIDLAEQGSLEDSWLASYADYVARVRDLTRY